ncbi:hypothetical protein AVEN_71875-1, partial [Araneus ventricosus]
EEARFNPSNAQAEQKQLRQIASSVICSANQVSLNRLNSVAPGMPANPGSAGD